MTDGPNFAYIATMMGDPARSNMLSALMSGQALTATELSQCAGVTPQTASSHLNQLLHSGLIHLRKKGRHRYFTIANDDVAHTIETMTGLAASIGTTRKQVGPKDRELRHARVCYNHLAGYMGVILYDTLVRRRYLAASQYGLGLTETGASFITEFGIDIDQLQRQKTRLCRDCLDWSERRPHLAGALGRAILAQIEARGWISHVPQSRIIRFSNRGEVEFRKFLSN